MVRSAISGLLALLIAAACLPPAAARAAESGPARYIVTYRTTAAADPGRASDELPAGADWLGDLGTGRSESVLLTPAERDALAADPDVLRVDPDLPVSLVSIPTAVVDPNDPRLAEQWSLGSGTAGIHRFDAPDAGDGAGIVVAVLDTGSLPHEDMAGAWTGGYDFVAPLNMANDGDARDADPSDPGDFYWFTWPDGHQTLTPSSWHGLHVASTIAARSGNGIGIAGVAPGVQIEPVRVLGSGGGSLSDIADAVRWAAGLPVVGVPDNPRPAKIINLSIQGTDNTTRCPYFLNLAINAAVAAGAIVVSAAGNAGADSAYWFPGNCNVVTVAATGPRGTGVEYSNHGSTVEIAAPGGNPNDGANHSGSVLGAMNLGDSAPGADGYALLAGTSMASPHIAGVAALMLSANPALSQADVIELLGATARPFAAGGNWCLNDGATCGAGIADAPAAVAAARERAGSATAISLTAPSGSLGIGTAHELAASASSGAAVSYTSLTPAACTVSATGRVAALAAGTCAVRVSAPRSGGSAGAVRRATIEVAAEAITFALPATLDPTGGDLLLSGASGTGGALAFSSRTPGVCTVSGTTLTALATGTCTVRAAGAVSTLDRSTVIVTGVSRLELDPSAPARLYMGEANTVEIILTTAAAPVAEGSAACGSVSTAAAGGSSGAWHWRLGVNPPTSGSCAISVGTTATALFPALSATVTRPAVLPRSSGGTAVTINAGAAGTADRLVDLDVVWPNGATALLVTEGGSTTRLVPAAAHIAGALSLSAGAAGTRTVSVAFEGVSAPAVSDSILYDATAPLISLPDRLYGRPSGATIRPILSDAGGGLSSGAASLTAAALPAGTCAVIPLPGLTPVVNCAAALAEGSTYVLRLTVTDSVGNGTTVDRTLIVDSTAPQVAIPSGLATRSATTVTIPLSVVEAASGMGAGASLSATLTLGTKRGNCTTISAPGLSPALSCSVAALTADGAAVLTVTALDAAGNTSTTTGTLRIDRTAPTVASAALKWSASTGAVLTLTWSGRDTGSGIAGVQVTTTTAAPGPVRSGSPLSYALSSRRHGAAVYVRTVDAAGNTSAWKKLTTP
jgi:subtilisin family serine protease